MKSEKVEVEGLPPHEETVINSDLNALHGVPLLALVQLYLLPRWLIQLVCGTKDLLTLQEQLVKANEEKSSLQRYVNEAARFFPFLALTIFVFCFGFFWYDPKFDPFQLNRVATASLIGVILLTLCLFMNRSHAKEHRQLLGDDVPIERLRVLDLICREVDRSMESFEILYDQPSDGEVIDLFRKVAACRRYSGKKNTGNFDIFSLVNLSEREGRLLFRTGLMLLIYRILEKEGRSGRPETEHREILADMIDTLHHLDVISKTMTIEEVYHEFFSAAQQRLKRYYKPSEVH